MVNIIIPTFNRAPFLKKAVDSVLSQTYKDFELIIIDDGSTDDTTKIVLSYKPHMTYIKTENKGVSAARNLGIENSNRDFIAFLDSDDWWDRKKLEIQVGQMQKYPDYLISHTQETWYKDGRLLRQKKKHRKFHGYIFDKCLPLCAVSMSTVMVKRKLFDEVGLFDETLACCEDYDFWLRVSARHQFLLIDEPLTLKDGGRKDQVSYIHRVGMDKFRIQAIVKLLKSGILNNEQRELAIQELNKKCNIYGNGCIKYGKIKERKYYLELLRQFRW